MKTRRAGVVTLSILVVATTAALVASWRPSIVPIASPAASSFAEAEIAAGARLAALGDCAVCHIGRDGQAYAGGSAVATPFGAIHATNITPDPDTGIGSWSLAAFRRAMTDGVARDGSHLYPAFPYNHFSMMGDDDIAALYAFLMTRRPVRASALANHLGFPFNFRPLLAGWDLLFAPHHPFRPDPSRRDAWNRGAYLVKTVGHCGACHTPHNALGGEVKHVALSGGQADGWDAPALNQASTAPEPWTEARLFLYLRTGVEDRHGAAAGPMAPVIAELSRVPEADVQAIAIYIASLMPAASASPAAQPAVRPVTADAAILFAGACGACHGPDAPGGRVSLALSTTLAAPEPNDAARLLLVGLQPPAGQSGPFMPGFAEALTDTQLAELLRYLREDIAGRPAWTDLDDAIRRARQPATE